MFKDTHEQDLLDAADAYEQPDSTDAHEQLDAEDTNEQDLSGKMTIILYCMGILFKRRDSLTIGIYTDVDYAGSVDDRRSTTGYCCLIGGNLVTWRSQKQRVVARSSAEAKFRAMALGICEGIWIKKYTK
ncbi:unnamed protein product [Spirodela intermedia]|uniref:Mitochondrial protein n=1 Tax=Spirodela intermedia TaxID=51605 RepID=A0ABN7ECA1_SPIIN|nr:unnamed protein product [Spirodela intermedia]